MAVTQGSPIRSLSVGPAEYLLSERYEALIRVSQAIASHRDPKDLFRAMVTELHRVVQFDGIVVAQYDEASNEILWNACEVCSQQGPSTPPPIPADETITKWVYQRQEPLVIPSLDRESRFPRMMEFLKEKGFQSVCALPLTTVHRRIGSIAIASKAADAYCAEEVRFLSLVADQVALAIDDALNFEASQIAQAALQHKNERLKLLLEVNNTIVSNLELRDLLTAISASLRSVMQCDAVGVALPDSDSQTPAFPRDRFSGQQGPQPGRDRHSDRGRRPGRPGVSKRASRKRGQQRFRPDASDGGRGRHPIVLPHPVDQPRPHARTVESRLD